MARQIINLGATGGDGTGAKARAGGQIINENFEEVYTLIEILSRIDIITENKGFSLVGNDLTINADWEWIINNEIYTNPDAVVFTDIALSDAGKTRLVYVVPNATNGFDMLDGEETTGTPVAPELTNGGMYVTYFEVTDSVIGDPADGYDGNALVNKEDKLNKNQPSGYAGLDDDGKVFGLENVDNTADIDKPVSTAQAAADTDAIAAANTYTDTVASDKVDKDGAKVLTDNNYTTSEKNKLASIDATHYLAPLQTTVQLSALSQAGISDKARVYVEDELSDYFYDITATSGDIAPDDQTGGVGFWRKVAVGGETAASIKAKYESNADTNAYTDAEQALVVTISGKEVVSNKTDSMSGNTTSSTKYLSAKGVYDWAAGLFQAILVSGTNIKTINGSSLLGSGDMTVGSSETTTTLGALIGSAGDATPNDSDYVATALTAGGILKKITWTNVKAFLKMYFDGLYLVPQITITTSVNITTATNDASGFGQKGRNVVIDNSTNAINITVDGGTGFAASYLKHGTGAITFVQGSGRTLAQVNGTAVLNGIVGSTAAIVSVGTKDYLYISNY